MPNEIEMFESGNFDTICISKIENQEKKTKMSCFSFFKILTTFNM